MSDVPLTCADQSSGVEPITASLDLRAALQEAVAALAGGLWDYGPGQDEHAKCNEVLARCRSALDAPAEQAQTVPKLVLALPVHEKRRIVVASDETEDGERLVCVAIEDPPQKTAATPAQLLDWLERHPNCEPSVEYDEDSTHRVIHRVTGCPNDREWTEIGRGATLHEAIMQAMKCFP